MKSALISGAWLILFGVISSGCKPDECTRMMECCGQVRDMEGVGKACGPMAESARDPNTCRSINQTIRYMLEDRKKPIPAVCK